MRRSSASSALRFSFSGSTDLGLFSTALCAGFAAFSASTLAFSASTLAFSAFTFSAAAFSAAKRAFSSAAFFSASCCAFNFSASAAFRAASVGTVRFLRTSTCTAFALPPAVVLLTVVFVLR